MGKAFQPAVMGIPEQAGEKEGCRGRPSRLPPFWAETRVRPYSRPRPARDVGMLLAAPSEGQGKPCPYRIRGVLVESADFKQCGRESSQ